MPGVKGRLPGEAEIVAGGGAGAEARVSCAGRTHSVQAGPGLRSHPLVKAADAGESNSLRRTVHGKMRIDAGARSSRAGVRRSAMPERAWPRGGGAARARGAAARRRAAACAVGVLLCAACVHVPPENVVRDRFEYGQALSDSWKRQTLMNVVRLRYADAPVFLEVASVIDTYSQSGTISAGIEAYENPEPSMLAAGGMRAWSNSPTVTYQPLSGDKFTRSLLSPIPPAALLQMTQAGWPVELVFPAAIRSINGLRNQTGSATADPRFEELVATLGRIQRAGATGMQFERIGEDDVVVMVIRRGATDAAGADALRVRELLGLETGLDEFVVTFGAVPRSKAEVAILTRSMLEIMLELAMGIDVPPADAQAQKVLPGSLAAGPGYKPLVHIRSGSQAPAGAYAAVPYKDSWFWIDDDDVPSKRVFTFLMILFSLSESGQPAAGPLVTIGAGK